MITNHQISIHGFLLLRKPQVDIGYFRSSFVEYHHCRRGITYHGLYRHRLWDHPPVIDAPSNDAQKRLKALSEKQETWKLDFGAAYKNFPFALELFQEYKEKYDLVGVGNLNAPPGSSLTIPESSFTFLGYEPYIIDRCYPIAKVFGKYEKYFHYAENYLNEFGLFSTIEQADRFTDKFTQIPVDGSIEQFDCMTLCYLTLHENFAVYRYNDLG